MKHRLLTSTAVGALLATSGYVYAEGLGLRFFGGLNILSDDNFQSSFVSTITNTILRTGVARYEYTGSIFSSSAIDGQLDADTGYIFGAAVSYGWDNGLSIDLEAAYRRNKLDLASSGFSRFRAVTTRSHDIYGDGISDLTTWNGYNLSSTTVVGSADGHASVTSLMANAWYEFNLGNSQWKPYIGGGVGIAWVDLHANGQQTSSFFTGSVPDFGGNTTSSGATIGTLIPVTPILTGTGTTIVSLHGHDSGFAWQLGAGIGYEFAPGKQITLDYRYFRGPDVESVDLVVGGSSTEIDIDYDYSAHNLMFGIKLGL